MNFYHINLSDITLSNIKKHNDIKYFNIYYLNSPLILSCSNLKFSKYIENYDHYIASFIITDKDLYNFIENINIKIIDYIHDKCFTIFSESFDKEKIKNLFFSNLKIIENTFYLDIKTYSIDQLKNKNINENINIEIKILGVWIFKNMFGITFEEN